MERPSCLEAIWIGIQAIVVFLLVAVLLYILGSATYGLIMALINTF